MKGMNNATASKTADALEQGIAFLREDFPSLGADIARLDIERVIRKVRFDLAENGGIGRARESELLEAVGRLNAFDGDSILAEHHAASVKSDAEVAARNAADAAEEARKLALRNAAPVTRGYASCAHRRYSDDEAGSLSDFEAKYGL